MSQQKDVQSIKIAFIGDDFAFDLADAAFSYRVPVGIKCSKELKQFLESVCIQCKNAPALHSLEVDMPLHLFHQLNTFAQPVRKFDDYADIKTVPFIWG